MKGIKLGRPSPALVVAMAALLFAMGGTAGAVVAAAVPLAKRALVADNAKKLEGQSLAQLTAKTGQAIAAAASAPGPASTAGGLVVVKSQAAGQISAGTSLGTWSVACDSGTKVIGGGMASDGAVATFDSYPKGDAAWEVVGGNLGGSAANVTVYAICLR